MKLLKVIALLLDYPDERLLLAHDELYGAIENSDVIGLQHKAALIGLLKRLTSFDLMDMQEDYLDLFDRGRSRSLFLFEHVHGDSRDRGQAMVDLLSHYHTHGFAIHVRELPDYLPLYLEYLSTRSHEDIVAGLGDVAHILTLLAERLNERVSAYVACFNALLFISGVKPGEQDAVTPMVSTEPRDESLEALDRQWEEEAVNFLQAEQQARCTATPQGSGRAAEVPVHWVDFNTDSSRPAASTTEVRHV